MISAILFISFFIFLILGLPIAICLGLSSVCAILYSGTSLTIVATNMYSGISKFLLLAIPFFVLSGNIMAKAGISKRLINFVDTCVGHKKGGIAIVCVIVACFFGAISGSGPATVAALGAVLIPAMVEQGGFSAPFSTALMATSSSIAIVIPPSIAFVVYASITGVSIADMFMAGIVPGLLMGVALVIIVMIEAKKHNIQPSREKASAKERWDTFKDAFWGFLMPVIILGGIYGGIFTPTEAAAVSVVYGLFVGMVIYREVKLKDLFDILVDSAKTTGGIMLIVASASLFSFVCTKFGIANAASELLASIAHNQFTFLLIVNIIFLIAGCFIDANSAMYIFVPIMLPVCKALGYDVVAFGVMATVNLAIGQVTPPVGVNLFVAISIKIKKGLEVTLQQISRAVMPMIAASVAVLLIITYIPAVSTALPKALAKEGSYTGDQSSDTGSQSSKDAGDGSDSFNTIADYSDLDWPEMTWNFACSTTETSTWADGGRKFGELMEKATGGKVKVNIYAADQLTNGNQSEGIQALMNGDPVQISMHSNLIYSAFDPRFNVVSLPFIYDSYDDADAKFDGAAGDKLKEILSEYGLHCMGIAENGFRELTNSVREVKSVDDMKNLPAKLKFCVQILAALIVIFSGTRIQVVLWPVTAYLQKFSIPITLVWIVGVTNAVNLIDGLDGLAAGSSAIIGVALGILAYMSSHFEFASFLNIMFIPGAEELVVFAAAFIGATVGFLWYNAYPAQVFMGDTGSLALGGFVASAAYMLQMPIFIIIVGFIYLVEVLSVMIQVTYFKKTGGKRIFKMAPIHHHFELCGWSETRVVAVFSIITALLCLVALMAM